MKLVQKPQPATAKNFPQRNEKTSPVVLENHPTGSMGGGTFFKVGGTKVHVKKLKCCGFNRQL